jgi:[ribosomal protein S5]-alanine N-acetyltransferase
VGLKEFVTRASEEQAVLTTVRLVLRRPAEEDLPSIVKHANDWEVARLLGRMPHPYTMDDARFFLEKVVPNELTWAITSRADDTFIGAIGLAPGVPGGVAELGYWLGVASGATALPPSRGHQSTGAPALRFRAVGRRH